MRYFTYLVPFYFLTCNYLVLILIVNIFLIELYFNYAFKYWKKRDVPMLGSPKIPVGDLPIFDKDFVHFGEYLKNKYLFGKSRGFKHGGLYTCTSPGYMPIDLDYLKHILLKNFNHFSERGFYYNERDDPLSANVFAIGGKKWEFFRAKLSPAFTPNKLKMVFENVLECAEQMHSFLQIDDGNRQVNIQDILQRYTIDAIGSCVFGLQCNSFKHPDAEFPIQGKKIFAFTLWRTIKTAFEFSYPDISRWMGLRLFDKESTDFFVNIVKKTKKHREKHQTQKKDFLQILLELKNVDRECNEEFTVEELAAQVFVFFAAGFETSALTLTFCLYELAINEEIQSKLRNEIKDGLDNETITYESIINLKYLNQVVEETLRKYPPVSVITRVCTKDFLIPKTETVIEKGVAVGIPILGIHHDPEYYPNPEVFDPDRFSETVKKTRDAFTYMPFGEGPRICIGLRFGLLQMKVALIVLLQNYKFSLSENTKVPFKVNPYCFTLVPEEDIVLNIAHF